jgi:hypothetical protein
MSWTVESFVAVDDGVVVTGTFGAVRATLLFPVKDGPKGVLVVARPEELQSCVIPPGGSEQAVMEAIRVFFEVAHGG